MLIEVFIIFSILYLSYLDWYYITGVVYNPATAVLRKIWNSTSIYSKFFNIGPAAASFVLDNIKQFMYFTATSTSDYYLFRIDLSDGSISRSLHSGSNVNVWDKGFCKIVLNENESWLYFGMIKYKIKNSY